VPFLARAVFCCTSHFVEDGQAPRETSSEGLAKQLPHLNHPPTKSRGTTCGQLLATSRINLCILNKKRAEEMGSNPLSFSRPPQKLVFQGLLFDMDGVRTLAFFPLAVFSMLAPFVTLSMCWNAISCCPGPGSLLERGSI